jgi:hypothetical protein
MAESDVEIVVVVVRFEGRIRWFRSDRDLWVLDVEKWRNEFIALGHEVPDFNGSFRFGLRVVNETNAREFLDHMAKFEVRKDDLSIELARRFRTASSWWDVKDLFPVVFVNFDNRSVAAFYSEGTPMERYVPDGWKGEFIDFANECSEDVFPSQERFWIKGGSDLLKLLNERATKK